MAVLPQSVVLALRYIAKKKSGRGFLFNHASRITAVPEPATVPDGGFGRSRGLFEHVLIRMALTVI